MIAARDLKKGTVAVRYEERAQRMVSRQCMRESLARLCAQTMV